MNDSMKIAEAIHDMTALIGKNGKVETVFGEPREIKGRVVIPAAAVRGGTGGGGGSGEVHPGVGGGNGTGSAATTSSAETAGTTTAQTASGGAGSEQEAQGGGMGAGFGLQVRPLGWLVVSDDRVQFQPVIDISKMTAMGAIVGVVALLAIRKIFRRAIR